MGNVSFLQALRRYWWIVVAFAAVGATIAAIPEPTEAEDTITTRYRASHTILVTSTDEALFSNPQAVNQLPLFATVGEVPLRAVSVLEFDGSPAALAAQVTVEVDQQTGALRISTTQDSAQRAVQIANTLADELVSYLAERQDELREDRVTAAVTRLEELETQLREAETASRRLPDDAVLESQLNALSRQYGVAFEQFNALTSEDDGPQLVLTTLERAQPIEITESTGLGAPRSRLSRGLLGGLIGAVLGAGVALLVARADRKVRTREQIEEVLGMSAQVTIPKVAGHHAGDLAVVPGRHDPLSDSYRRLRSLLSFIHAGIRRQQPADAEQRAPITLIVSASAGDGKTSMAANLASAFVEAGDRTIAVNADFRRPTLSRRLAVIPPDLTQYTLDDLGTVPAAHVLAPVAGVNLAVLDLAGLHGSSPGDLARATGRVLPGLAEMADQIVIDSSPVGATAETLELVPLANTIVMVVTLGHTSAQAARSALETIQKLSSGTVLLAVIGADADDASDYYYYYSRTNEQAGERSGRFGWLPGRRKQPADDAPVATRQRSVSSPVEDADARATDEPDAAAGDAVTPPTGVPVVEPSSVSDR